MPANDEFPRGWFRSISAGSNVVASIVIPAVAGINHILTEVTAKLVNETAGANFFGTIAVQSSDGLNQPLAFIATDQPAAGHVTQDEVTISGIAIPSGIGNSLTVLYNAAQVNTFEFLSVKGYDI